MRWRLVVIAVAALGVACSARVAGPPATALAPTASPFAAPIQVASLDPSPTASWPASTPTSSDASCLAALGARPGQVANGAQLTLVQAAVALLEEAGRLLSVEPARLSLPAGLEQTEEWGPGYEWYAAKVAVPAPREGIVLYVDRVSGVVIEPNDFEACWQEVLAARGKIAPDVADMLADMGNDDVLTVAITAAGADYDAALARVRALYPNASFDGGRPQTGDDALNIEIMTVLRAAYSEASLAATAPIADAARASGATIEYSSRYAPMIWIKANASTIQALAVHPSVASIDSSGTLAPQEPRP